MTTPHFQAGNQEARKRKLRALSLPGFLASCFLSLCLSSFGADIQKGFTFTSGAPDNSVTHTKLNNLVDNATVLPGLITGKTEKTTLATDDFFLIYDTAGAALKKARLSSVTPALPVLGTARRLVIKNNASGQILDVTADEVILKTPGGLTLLAAGVSVSPSMSVTGANGHDGGVIASPSWQHVWLISNGTATAGLLSASSTTPAMPSGYTYKALVGVASYNVSFRKTFQVDRRVYQARVAIATNQAGVSSTYSTLPAGVITALSFAVPPIARAAHGTMGVGTGTVANDRTMAVAGNADAVGQVIASFGITTLTNDGMTGSAPFTVPLLTPQSFMWATLTTASVFHMQISGFDL